MDDTSGPSAFNPVNPSTSLQQQQFWQPNRCQRILHLWHRRRAARELFGIQSGRSPPSPFPLLHLLLSLCLLVQPTSCAGSRTNEIEVDWTGTTTAAEANTKANFSSDPTSHQQQSRSRSLVQTKYVRLKDLLRFRCPSDLSLAIHLVSPESALLCQLPPEQKDRDRALVGFCGPKSTDPRLILRRYSPLPGKPSFEEGQSYFFISTSDGTPEGSGQSSGGLCRSLGLRLRIVVLPSSADGGLQSRPADELTDLAALLFPASPPNSADIRPKPVKTSESPAVFPAILTLEEGGQRRKVLVHSQRELAEQIDLASQTSDQPRKQPMAQDAYEFTDNSRWPLSRGGSVRRKPAVDSAEEKPAAKSVRSPEPLAESQRLVYIIGYDGHEPGGGARSNKAVADTEILVLLLLFSICTTTAFSLFCWPTCTS